MRSRRTSCCLPAGLASTAAYEWQAKKQEGGNSQMQMSALNHRLNGTFAYASRCTSRWHRHTREGITPRKVEILTRDEWDKMFPVKMCFN